MFNTFSLPRQPRVTHCNISRIDDQSLPIADSTDHCVNYSKKPLIRYLSHLPNFLLHSSRFPSALSHTFTRSNPFALSIRASIFYRIFRQTAQSKPFLPCASTQSGLKHAPGLEKSFAYPMRTAPPTELTTIPLLNPSDKKAICTHSLS